MSFQSCCEVDPEPFSSGDVPQGSLVDDGEPPPPNRMLRATTNNGTEPDVGDESPPPDDTLNSTLRTGHIRRRIGPSVVIRANSLPQGEVVDPMQETMRTGSRQQHRSRSMEQVPPSDPVPPTNPFARIFGMDPKRGITLNLTGTPGSAGNSKKIREIDRLPSIKMPFPPEDWKKDGEGLEEDESEFGSKKSSLRQYEVSDLESLTESQRELMNNSWRFGGPQREESLTSVVSGLTQGQGDKEVTTDPNVPLLPFEKMAMAKSSRSMYLREEEAFPNNPHPSLECPPLYFCLRRFPPLISWIRSLYSVRWSASYPLQRRIWGTRYLRKVGIFLTWGELFLLLPFAATVIIGILSTFWRPDVSISGHVARTPLIFAFATAQRNSFLALLLGIPFERALFYHKLSARVAYCNGLLHTYVAFFHPLMIDGMVSMNSADGSDPHFFKFLFEDQVNSGGSMLVFFMSGMILTALPWVRKKAFELFYYVHVVFAASMVICAFFHTGIIVPILAGIVWGGDLFMRKIVMAVFRYPKKATLTIISDSVVEVRFPKTNGFDYNPGQYIYIAVPELSIFEWHPFSLSSSPEQKLVTLHIRKAGSWTNRLYGLAEEKSQREVSILIEGPYGSISVDLMSDRYKMMMLFSGGIGVTPMQSICNQLMYEHSTKQRKLKHLSFVWVERDPIVMPEVDVVRRTSSMHVKKSASDFGSGFDVDTSSEINSVTAEPQGIAATLLSMVPQSKVTDEQLELEYPEEEFEDLDESGDDNASLVTLLSKLVSRSAPVRKEDEEDIENGPLTGANGEENTNQRRTVDRTFGSTKYSDIDLDEETFINAAYKFEDDDDSDYGALDLQVYLTAKKNKDSPIASLPFVHLGRPDVKALFRKMRDEAIAKGEKRVAVCVCAPLRLVVICRKACAKYSDKQVRFDFHEEVFE